MSGCTLLLIVLLVSAFFSLLHYLWVGSIWVIAGVSSPLLPNISRFEVHSLPKGPALPRNWAGRLEIPEVEEGNSLFFWLFEAEEAEYDENLIRLTTGGGPVIFEGNTTNLVRNPYSWSKLGHVLYIDQPAGTGFSTASNPYPVTTQDRVSSDFYKWMQGFFSHFPHLSSKRVHMMGESYAGIYIPYFASEILKNHESLPINIASLSLGDGTWGDSVAMSSAATGAYLRLHRSLLNISEDTVSAFTEADQMCRFDTVMQQASEYPPTGTILVPGNGDEMNIKLRFSRDTESAESATCNTHPKTADEILASILNSTCDERCATFSTAINYLSTANKCFDVYNIRHGCDTANPMALLEDYFNRADVQIALNIHPQSRDAQKPLFQQCNHDILTTLLSAPTPPTAPAYDILPRLITTENISVHIYSGEYDMLVNHLGTELCLQNMSWRGAQGFTEKPYRVFYTDQALPETPKLTNGEKEKTSRREAGIFASERGLTYHLFWGAGHTVISDKPQEMFAYVRDVVLGS
ncbi:hypothetical protein ASPZODRAFT_18277 [Penicilliopsis zonata CBS 506.65]|uniref:Carboxypeptidase n=1 Tax=Penicilliopsis zonata CBS 506.65 TaxID=1073090 RepID=A0A1L9SC22_9EURO|nr:hypothetical protein ASPZODRAFT_18277 [Penicilliopsis zonata CBS 506.65]OJJ44703.1 hypothetical protein ASPZODRAFT_18277 [Penicilliopsis zonata CBS 506.65]